MTPIAIASRFVAEATRIVAFTGAGISAESGIPTYRDTDDALWKKYDPDKFANIDYFMQDSTLYWNFFQDVRYQAISNADPNPGHIALAEMERAGRLRAVITQNIDGLHQQAGSERVIELHGNTRSIGCLQCGERYTMEAVYEQLKEALPPPCKACGGMLKPEVVFFGESLPPGALQAAAQEAATCDLLIAIGSSLQVYPAAGLPEQAKISGARLIVINKTPTLFDGIADAMLREASGTVLPILAEAAVTAPANGDAR
jgi:NAD-dependent deacetylase